ncbi:MAG: phenylalanine--tRNA ligase subunit alpha [Candidatus Marinimicrobia bacterium]|nr:phenylalanine--tRNA ligase subunit alpha [Candidatus Neomarinimicrobiota bacterium]
MSFQEKIEAVRTEFRAALDSFPNKPQEIEELKSTFLGRKGKVASLFAQMGSVDPSERPNIGKLLNQVRNDLTELFENKRTLGASNVGQKQQETIDYSLPGHQFRIGSLHPLQQTMDEIKTIFRDIGFSIAYGPEIDDDYHNFQALNIPKHHPARDMQDTFFIEDNVVLRTHTSNVQIHLMENQDPPLRYIVPGRVYRNEAISFKSYCLFHQVEGLFVDKHVSFTELKSTLTYFIHRMFGRDTKVRFRPSFFPFTEPSAEVDLWNEERGQWMEILGCGMVDPAVFESVGYDPEVWQGYAFGMGVERMAMLKYKIDDIRLFYQNDVRFLEQF